MLGQSEGTFNDVSVFVEASVEFRGSATAAAAAFASGDGVAFLRDDSGDTATAELAADRAGRVGLVCDHRVGAGAGSALAVAWDVDVEPVKIIV
ncbi:hypothetical protein AYJ66_17075 [Dietzia cinnamea]|nr:hypothetical protein AYJ66_17075 [Dietzia cinnamea]